MALYQRGVGLGVLLLAFAAATPHVFGLPALRKQQTTGRENWHRWRLEWNKEYSSIEEAERKYAVWYTNHVLVQEHNRGNHSWTMKLNAFADMTDEEFVQHNGLIITEAPNVTIASLTNKLVPDSIDWRKHNLVNPVQNQGSCGSCWAFSTVVSIEAAHAKATGTLAKLSEQNLVDCVKNEHVQPSSLLNPSCCHGCQGGLMNAAMDYIVTKQGGQVDTESSYPYKGRNGQCKFSSSNSGATISGFHGVKQGDENGLLSAVSSVGPISVGVDASKGWQFYHRGIMTPSSKGGLFHRSCSSSPRKMDHGVAAVGFGSDAGKDYWIVRNSWGASWGEQGYIRIVRGQNACGIANAAVYPVGAQ